MDNIYCYCISETLERYVYVQAPSADEAEEIVNEMYDDEEIVLTAEDFKETDIAEITNGPRSEFEDINDDQIIRRYNNER